MKPARKKFCLDTVDLTLLILYNGSRDDRSAVHSDGMTIDANTSSNLKDGMRYDLVTVPADAPRSRLQVIQDLTRTIPKNEFGMPAFLYRPDLIPEDFDDMDPIDKDQILYHATLGIAYAEGFPALSDGTPIWGPLPYEAPEAYTAFTHYMDLAESHGVRRVDVLNAAIPTIPRSVLIEYHTYYYWSLRGRAHDLYQIAAAQKMRERRILRTNDRHYLEAEKLLGQVLNWFGKTDEDGDPIWQQGLSANVAMNMLEKLTKIQRVSLGLPANGPINGDEETPKNANLELILRKIAENSGDTTQNSAQNVVDMLLNDPESAMMAQELILKVNSNGKVRKISEVTHNPTTIAEELG